MTAGSKRRHLNKGGFRMAAGYQVKPVRWQPRNFATLPKIQPVAPRGWQQKNFQLVLSTDVIRGKSGHPNILAAHFW